MRKFNKFKFSTTSRIFGNKPLLFPGGASHWPALQKWTNGYLSQFFGRSDAQFFFSFDKESQRKKLTGLSAKDAFEKIIQGNTSDRYYLTRQPLSSDSILRNDIEVPNEISSKRFYMPHIWAGQSKSLTPLHYDSTDGYLCQIDGMKKIYFLAPQDSAYLYPKTPLTGGRFNLSNITELHNIAVANTQSNFLYTSSLHSMLLKPGDTVYIPAGWWHQVHNLGYSLAVNFFFTDESRGYSPKQEILMYQACKSREKSKISDIIGHISFESCLKDAVSLLEINCLDYAAYCALVYFEEYIKAHLLNYFFSEIIASNNDFSNSLQKLIVDVFDSQQSQREAYYHNIEKANEYLKLFNHAAYIPTHCIKSWVSLAKKILNGNDSVIKPKEVERLINEIKSVCTYQVYKKQDDVQSLSSTHSSKIFFR